MTAYLGKSIGKIRIVESLGSGGSGDVYVGFDEKLKRKVAVKALRGEKRFDVNARARLAREAEILSQLDHPNICRIYDYLEHDECDFLILELVQGENLREMDPKEVSHAAKMKIARQIAMALSAAHERNVVHRDLKPQNVMINGDGDVKVLDFGLAHSTLEPDDLSAGSECSIPQNPSDEDHQDDTQDTSFSGTFSSFRTEYGRVTGTPMYLSPEQARSETMTAASDMYSFGLLVQWIFTGAHPHSKKLPSQRLIWLAVNGESRPVKGVQADLATLINRLKSVAPEMRPTAVEAADRLEWIQSAPKRKRRRIELFVVGLVLLTATCASIFDNLRARSAEKRALVSKKVAVEAQAETKAVNAFLSDMLASADPENEGIHVKVIDVLDLSAREAEKTLAEQPKTKAAVLHSLGMTYLGIGAPEKAHTNLLASWEIRRREFGENHEETLSTKTQIGNALISLGKYPDAEILLLETLGGYESSVSKNQEDVLAAQAFLAKVFQFSGKYQKSEDLYRKTWHAASEVLGEDHQTTLEAMTGLAWSLQHQSKHAQAEEIHEKALAAQTRYLGAEHPDTLASMYGLAAALQYQKKLDRAETILRKTMASSIEVFGADHANTLASMDSLATVLADQD